MITRERVEAVLERVRPFLRADGGDIELIDVSGN
ncbi:MAG: NifU family protein, partial [Acidobacteria bacterium]|nr:NifU family protein [Acidobacteriota bacterium]